MTTRGFAWFPGVLGSFLLSTTFMACSLALDASVTQCRSDKDCQRGAQQGGSLVCRAQVCVVEGDGGAGPNALVSNTDGGTPPSDEATLPFAVDGAFFTSGYMGDGEKQFISENACPAGARGGDGRGRCHKFVYQTGPASVGWGGLYWQHPANNWEKATGYLIPAGAKSVIFYAWSTASAPAVTFAVGILRADGFEVRSSEIRLGTSPTRYVIDLADVEYADVVGGFAFSTMAPREGSLELFLDDIVWSDQPARVATVFTVDTRSAPLASGCGVRLRGSFDTWGNGVAMKDSDKDGIYEASVDLAPNQDLQYRFAKTCDGGRVDEELSADTSCAPVTAEGGPARVVRVPHGDSQVAPACLGTCTCSASLDASAP